MFFKKKHQLNLDFMPNRCTCVFQYFGHEKVSVLDGGLDRWIASGYSTSSDIQTVPVSNGFDKMVNVSILANIIICKIVFLL